jgi:molybdenum cofactor guanylyltransferase
LIAAGLVLAGGDARRMGGEKAFALYNSAPLIAWPLETLRAHLPVVGVNPPARLADACRALGAPLVMDDPALLGRGPLVGVLAGLHWAQSLGDDHVLITAPCDAPLLPADFAPRLIAQAEKDDVPIVVAAAEREHYLCALWRPSVAGRLEVSLTSAARGLSVRAFLAEVGYARASFADERAFANVNTAADIPPDSKGA